MSIEKPGTAGIAARDMHFFWIVDCSGSMQIAGKMEALNNAVKEALPAMRDVAEQNPFAKMLIRAIAFSSGATWTVANPVPVADFQWTDLQADGVTDMGCALEKVAEQLDSDKLGTRGFPPILVLLSDGQPTDDWKKGLKKILSTNWGKRAARVAIAIGPDADHEPLKAFVNNPEFPVLQANNPEQLVKYIKWVSSTVSQSVVAPPSQLAGQKETDSPLPPPPSPPAPTDARADDGWVS